VLPKETLKHNLLQYFHQPQCLVDGLLTNMLQAPKKYTPSVRYMLADALSEFQVGSVRGLLRSEREKDSP
jgi:hypothetical protein